MEAGSSCSDVPRSLMLFACSVAQACLTLQPHGLVARQAPLSMEFSRQEYWSGLPFPAPVRSFQSRDQTMSPALAGEFFTTMSLWRRCRAPLSTRVALFSVRLAKIP